MTGQRYNHYGVRVIDDDAVVAVGDILAVSGSWHDCDYDNGCDCHETGGPCYLLDGTSAVDLTADWREHLQPYLPLGSRYVVLGSEFRSWGEDPHEVVMQDAVVLAILPQAAKT